MSTRRTIILTIVSLATIGLLVVAAFVLRSVVFAPDQPAEETTSAEQVDSQLNSDAYLEEAWQAALTARWSENAELNQIAASYQQAIQQQLPMLRTDTRVSARRAGAQPIACATTPRELLVTLLGDPTIDEEVRLVAIASTRRVIAYVERNGRSDGFYRGVCTEGGQLFFKDLTKDPVATQQVVASAATETPQPAQPLRPAVPAGVPQNQDPSSPDETQTPISPGETQEDARPIIPPDQASDQNPDASPPTTPEQTPAPLEPSVPQPPARVILDADGLDLFVAVQPGRLTRRAFVIEKGPSDPQGRDLLIRLSGMRITSGSATGGAAETRVAIATCSSAWTDTGSCRDQKTTLLTNVPLRALQYRELRIPQAFSAQGRAHLLIELWRNYRVGADTQVVEVRLAAGA